MAAVEIFGRLHTYKSSREGTVTYAVDLDVTLSDCSRQIGLEFSSFDIYEERDLKQIREKKEKLELLINELDRAHDFLTNSLLIISGKLKGSKDE